jgi:hypothetical protein
MENTYEKEIAAVSTAMRIGFAKIPYEWQAKQIRSIIRSAFTTKSGSLYMRNFFDKDAANPNSGSIWTTRMLFMVSVSFLFGTTIGSFFLRFGVALHSGMVIPWVSLFGYLMIEFVTHLVIFKWFDWSRPIMQE